MNSVVLKHQEGLQFLSNIPDNSVDLILTDPPYITSRDSGMDKWVKHVAEQDKKDAKNLRTVEQWRKFKTVREWVKFLRNDSSLYDDNDQLIAGEPKRKLKKYKADYLKYGSIYGKKYAVKTNYGDWDSKFTMQQLEFFVKHFYRILKPGGTCIVFFDLVWSLSFRCLIPFQQGSRSRLHYARRSERALQGPWPEAASVSLGLGQHCFESEDATLFIKRSTF